MNSLQNLKCGNREQKKVYEAVQSLGVIENFKIYHPVICGTYPIDIYIDESDIDIIMFVEDFQLFSHKLQSHYSDLREFNIKEKIIRNNHIVKAQFDFKGFTFELFGQNVPVVEQYAYLHMKIENHILDLHPSMKNNIRLLKEAGIKTEPAFCRLLGIAGDPYEGLINYGRAKGII
ncbi:hypothetical conserved protein [Oceanobacillus iheyensis HTE831]|uniref:Hypothetical conserved protein n=1 Tax=Oceanobacillus iheyensis (strain DSM 14371 / CIP 107618 / JCM 11309 / KCTC 3954 / HTE831) TaxID=221109 RepID=Q8ES22_OCEIH|nr:DUF4269 domain-containing protein [Oceanobacillus iheyensis]BAC12777.1 hypothetical conserved protein [Oceanobacillus iheyensis HTE831]